VLAQHHSNYGFLVVSVPELGNPQSGKGLTQALALGAKLTAMGFVRYEGTPFFFLNLAYEFIEVPSLSAKKLTCESLSA
jgi:hypothetical protein